MDGVFYIIITVNVILLIALVIFGVWYGRRHLTPRSGRGDTGTQKLNLPASVKKELLSAAEHEYQMILDRSARDLQRDLKQTTERLNEQLSTFGSEVIDDEVHEYQEVIHALKNNAEIALTSSQQKMTELHESMAQEIRAKLEAEHQQLVQLMDKKLSAAVSSFIIESLEYNVDLGAQTEYLMKSLEAHKEELKDALK